MAKNKLAQILGKKDVYLKFYRKLVNYLIIFTLPGLSFSFHYYCFIITMMIIMIITMISVIKEENVLFIAFNIHFSGLS